MTRCLIVTRVAAAFADEIERLAGSEIPITACCDAEAALAAYTDEQILFGNPQEIAGLLPHMPTVAWVQSSWAGVTPLIDAPRRDYTLTGVKGVFGPQMSEYVLGYLLAHALKINGRLEQQRRRRWYREQSGTLAGKSIGIMGTGSIGAHIAATASAFNLNTLGLSRSGNAVDGFDAVWRPTGMNAFLARSHYLVSTLPATPETDRLLNANTLAKLPEGAVFVNVGRSNVVDHAALVDALTTGRLAAAVLDVFEEEPLPQDSPLWEAPNLFITAHVAAISHPLLIVPVFIENYRRFVAGEPLKYAVDFDAGY
jgi:phosphoglycerate dehydrogenase-like enzyme